MAKYVNATAKQTLHIEGTLYNVDSPLVLSELHANELEEKGLVQITGDASEDDAKEKKESSFSITDNTGKAKEKAEVDTDESNPTGKKEKSENAGPTSNKKAPAKGGKK